MNKKDIKEIKKQYNEKDCAISRIAIGYFDGNKEVKCEWNGSFLNLPGEEMCKYLDIFKRGLKGKIGKNICTLEYAQEQEAAGTMYESLLRLRSTRLQNEDVLHAFYEKVAENYPEVENVAVVLIYNAYDIPGRGDDGLKDMDASDEVYEYISCYLCPVELEEPGLIYNGEMFENKDRRWQIGIPMHGFVFPSFEDQREDVHKITVYNKKSDGAFDNFDQEVLGLMPIASADLQRQMFASALESAVANCEEPISVVSSIHEAIISDMEQSEKEDTELSYDKLYDIVKDAGISDEAADALVEELKENLDEKPVKASNIVDRKTTKIKSADMEIKIDAEKSSQIERREIDGVTYLLVPLEDESNIEINGVKVL